MKKEKQKNKRAQLMGMPFQVIFSLILVAVAIFVGFYVIKMFLERAEQANINDFVRNQLQYEIQSIWEGPEEASVTKELIFSKNFDYVCFLNQSKPCNSIIEDFCSNYGIWKTRSDNKENLFLVPLGKAEKYDAQTAWFLNCNQKECVTWQGNPLCLPVENGKVAIKFTKESGSNLVKVSRP